MLRAGVLVFLVNKELIRPHSSGGHLSWPSLHFPFKKYIWAAIPGELVKPGLDNACGYFFGTKNVTELEMILMTQGWRKQRQKGWGIWVTSWSHPAPDRWSWWCFFNLPLGETVTKRCDGLLFTHADPPDRPVRGQSPCRHSYESCGCWQRDMAFKEDVK